MNPATAPAATATAAAPPRRLAGDHELRPYVIVGDIGKGSFATVYKAYHEVTAVLPFSPFHL
jgi:serine/threonine-protein kinase ULK/ATG1